MKRFIIELPDGIEYPEDELVEGIKQRLTKLELANDLLYLDEVHVTACSIAPDTIVQVAQVRHCYGSNDEIEIDTPANMSQGEDGVWIQAWVFVPRLGSTYVPPVDEEEED